MMYSPTTGREILKFIIRGTGEPGAALLRFHCLAQTPSARRWAHEHSADLGGARVIRVVRKRRDLREHASPCLFPNACATCSRDGRP